jgi:hypothetical protein
MADNTINTSIAEQTRKDSFKGMVEQKIKTDVMSTAKSATQNSGLKGLFQEK